MPLTRNRSLGAIVLLAVTALGQAKYPVPTPTDDELERIVGVRLEHAVRVIAWRTVEPQRTNLFLYRAALRPMDEDMMRRVAQRFGVKGDLRRITGETRGHIGFAISDPNSTNTSKVPSLQYWITRGDFNYYGGDDGHRYNTTARRPEIRGVPSKEEAKNRGLELLPLLGLSTNDLHHQPDGAIKWTTSGSVIRYTDPEDKQRKEVVQERHVTFFQKIPGGGIPDGIGDGGALRFSFISEGKLSSIEWFFRQLSKAGEARPKSSKEIIANLSKRMAWTMHKSVPSSLTITNCVLAYPQGNSWLDQDYLWPYYKLTGTSSSGAATTVYVPLTW